MEERELLHTDGLSVGYHGKELIKEIGISLKRGEIVTLIGPNGAGKSTFLKAISGQIDPNHGTIALGPGERLSVLSQRLCGKHQAV